jgi:hypothetical protein
MMTRPKILFPAALILLLTVAEGLAAQTVPVRRLGLFIGCNEGDRNRSNLLYATTDADNMAALMSDIGGIDQDDMTILLNPDGREIGRSFGDMKQRIGMYRNVTGRIEIVFYYSGHSDEEGLLIGGERIRYLELRTWLKDLGADVTIAIIDSCSSGAFTRQKGGKKVSPFLFDDSTKMEGHAFLTSSSADEVSQESDTIQGSFFTYFLMAGLRGAADASGDGRITLNELYQHTYQETLYRTEKTMGGPQHPSYEIQMSGTGDLVMTDITKPSSSVVVGSDIGGRLFVRNERGQLISELDKIPGIPLVLALKEGTYTLTVKTTDSQTLGTRVTLESGDRKNVGLRDMSVSGIEITRLRGDGEDEEDEEEEDGSIGFSFSAFQGLTFPEAAETSPVNFTIGIFAVSGSVPGGGQVSLFGNNSRGVVKGIQAASFFNTAADLVGGAQVSSFYNRAGTDLLGVQVTGLVNVIVEDARGGQVAGIGNSVSNMEGIQSAGIYNIADDFKGFQGSGIFNISDDFRGVQYGGLFNWAGDDVTGIQVAGLFNRADEVHGCQAAGLFNLSTSSTGILLAPINISWDMQAVPLGLINISSNGIMDPSLWYDTDNILWASFRSGNERFFTMLSVGYGFGSLYEGLPDDTTNVWLSLGFGMRLRPTRNFYIDQSIGIKSELLTEEEIDSYNWDQENIDIIGIPSYRLAAGWEWGPHLAVEGGFSLDLRTPYHDAERFEDQTWGFTWGENEETGKAWGIYPAAFVGIRF